MERIVESARRMTMRSFYLVLVVAGLLGCGGSSSSETTTNGNTSNQASSGGEESVTLADFTAQVTVGALPGVCGRPDSSLRRCVTVDEQTCGAAFTAAMIGCSEHAAELNLPATVNRQSADATARTIARCAAQAYMLGLNEAGMVLQTPECQPATD